MSKQLIPPDCPQLEGFEEIANSVINNTVNAGKGTAY
jgi:hypothetical protein